MRLLRRGQSTEDSAHDDRLVGYGSYELTAGTDAERSFRAFYERWYMRAFDTARSMLGDDHDAASEVAQGLLIAVWKRWKKQTPEQRNDNAAVIALLYNRIDEYRKRRRKRERRFVSLDDDAGDVELLSSVTPEQWVEGKDAAAVMARAVGSLPERCRDTYILYRVLGHSYKEVARVMGCSEKTVDAQLQRAGKLLPAMLGRSGVRLDGGAVLKLLPRPSAGEVTHD